jgi:hypothetical protein
MSMSLHVIMLSSAAVAAASLAAMSGLIGEGAFAGSEAAAVSLALSGALSYLSASALDS